MNKSFLKSKTLWVNALGITVLVIQGYTKFIINPATQAAILGIVNGILRLVTKEPISW